MLTGDTCEARAAVVLWVRGHGVHADICLYFLAPKQQQNARLIAPTLFNLIVEHKMTSPYLDLFSFPPNPHFGSIK